MKRLIVLGCLGFLVISGIISTTVFTLLYFQSQNQLNVKTEELVLCKSASTSTTQQCDSTPLAAESKTETTFRDIGQDIKVTYPTTWTADLNTGISTDFAYEPIYGRIINKYELTLTKSSTELKFVKILGAVGGFASGLKAANEDWQKIEGSNLVRYSNKGKNDWKYSTEVKCSDLSPEMYGADELAGFEICVNPFFAGFGTLGASNVSIKSSNKVILEEADKIVVSALN